MLLDKYIFKEKNLLLLVLGISGEEHINNLAKALNLEHRSKVHMDSISSSHTLEHPSRQSNKLVELLNEKRFSSSFLTPNLSSSKLQPSHLTIPDPTSRASMCSMYNFVLYVCVLCIILFYMYVFYV